MISKSEYAPYFESYIGPILENETSIVENLTAIQHQFEALLTDIPSEKQLFTYAEGKWTIKEIIQHLIDTERVFAYRALSFARNDKNSLPGFDEDKFVEYSKANQRTYSALLAEMKTVRESTLHLFESFSEEDILRVGVGSDRDMSVRAAGFIIAGHQKHHLEIIKERYL